MVNKQKTRKNKWVIISCFVSLLLCMLSILFVCQNYKYRDCINELNNTIAKHDQTIAELRQELEKDQKVSDSDSSDEEDTDLESLINMDEIPAGMEIQLTQLDFSNTGLYFKSYEITDELLMRINGKSYQENGDIQLSDLRYLRLLHYDFEDKIRVGELIVNAALVDDFLDIFTQLFDHEYQIQSMYLVDNYWTGDAGTTDNQSIEHNNTSAFNYRFATGSTKLSQHALGRAIDINPQQNPYVSYSSGSPEWSHENANDYIDRTSGAQHMITEGDLCYQLFLEHGFTWGGDWTYTKDYQHFEKPSD